MPVFDFRNEPQGADISECTYSIFYSSESLPTPEAPILILDNRQKDWKHHSCGVFTNPDKRTAFEFDEEDGTASANILKIDARFVPLLRWLGENRIHVRLSGKIWQTDMLSIKSARSLSEKEPNFPLRMDFFSLLLKDCSPATHRNPKKTVQRKSRMKPAMI